MPTQRLNIALALAARGFRIFPLRPYKEDGAQKWKPAFKRPFDSATTDPEAIRQWFHLHETWGVAIACGDGLLAIDLDNKDGKRGSDRWAELDMMEGCPPTLVLPTSSGGEHWFYKVDRPCSPGVSKIAEGIDHRGDGSYVRVHDHLLTNHLLTAAVFAVPLADAPEWLLQRIGRPTERAANADQVREGTDLDSDYNVERAATLLQSLDPVLEGERNMRCWQTASDVRALGISRTMCQSLMLDHWDCQPMLDDEEMTKAINSAYDNAKQPVGAMDPDADFEAAPPTSAGEAQKIETKKPRLFLEWMQDIKLDTKGVYLVKNVLDQGAMSVLYGQSNEGKSFFAMDLAFHISAGANWRGNKVKQGTVVYVAAEGGRGSRARVAAIRDFRAQRPDAPFALMPCSVDLLDAQADLNPLIDLVRAASAERGACRLIVIDTLARAMGGGNENAADDMGTFIRHVDALRARTGAHVLIVHHSGKDQAKGARGHSSLRAATDTEIEISGSVARITKQRDMERSGPYGFSLESVTLGADDEGGDIKSAVVVEQAATDASADFALEPLKSKEDVTVLRALSEAIARYGVSAPAELNLPDGYNVATLETWKRAYREIRGNWDSGTRRQFAASCERLRDRRYVVAMYDYQWVRSTQGEQSEQSAR